MDEDACSKPDCARKVYRAALCSRHYELSIGRVVQFNCVSCGKPQCRRREHKKYGQLCVSCKMAERNMTHGEWRARLNNIWHGMRQRCSDQNRPAYPYYGGRGISVCKAWGSYEVFRDWALANGYESSLTIDRINNDGNYEPANCRWATMKVQNGNKRKPTKLSCEA